MMIRVFRCHGTTTSKTTERPSKLPVKNVPPKPSDTAQQCKIALLAPFTLHSTISKTICVKQHSQTQIIQPVLSNGAGSQKRDQTIANQMRKRGNAVTSKYPYHQQTNM
ncbi:Hypothetical_protein [Hexamita inflata]|uniref:Hypothetical_protein n=2 Tax=Hexamita inflata TaxID=28002 RepID=A0AA86Q0H4_9EUKA|nr:Hypothetical protein HINF_LOCUS32245 [Hexamita inflata]